ncbi:MAG TPA: DNA repair exonuclease [Bacilli bacterium]
MNAFRFLHCADLHLDTPFKGMSAVPDAIRQAIKNSTFAALQNVTQIALSENVDFVLIAGDLFDAAERSLRAQLFLRRELEKLSAAGIFVCIVHGNHDPENGGKAELAWPERVHFFSSDKPETLRLPNRRGQDAALVTGMSYGQKAVTENLAERFIPADSALYKIALLHANVDGDPAHDNYAPCSLSTLKQSGFDYWALGHIHARKVLHKQPYAVYPGNIQGRSVRELGPKGCYVANVTELGETSLTFHETDAIRFFCAEIPLDTLATEQDLQDELQRRMADIREQAEGRHAVVRFCFSGRTPLYRKLRNPTFLPDLLAELRGEEERAFTESNLPFVWIESVDDESAPPVDLAALARQDDFIAVMLQHVDKLLNDRGELAAFGHAALQPLFTSKAATYAAEPDEQTLRKWLAEARNLAVEALIRDAGWET